MKILAYNIVYETEGVDVRGLNHDMLLKLPDDIDTDHDLENEIADAITDETGWLVESFKYQILS